MKQIPNQPRRTWRAAAALAAAMPILASCALLGGSSDPNLYELSPKNTFPANLPGVNAQLLVQAPAASAGLTSARIAIKPKPTRLEYYTKSAWTDVAPNVVQTLILESFDNAGKIKGVEREGSGLRVDYLLKTDLREFQAELYEGKPRIVRVRIHAKLVRWSTREIVASHQIERRSVLKDDKIDAIVQGFDDALGKVLKRLIIWTVEEMNTNIRSQPVTRE